MLLSLGMGVAVIILTAASAWNNWQHMQAFGTSVAILVIGAELLKPLLPIALIRHAENKATGQWVGALVLWCIIVVFSFVNTMGNTLIRHAKDKARAGVEQASATRPEHIILGELAGLKSCPDKQEERREQQPLKGGKFRTVTVRVNVPDTDCQQQVAAVKLALTAELTEQKTRQGKDRDIAVGPNTATDGYIALANAVGLYPKRHEMDVYTVLLWTLLAELGSALGALCIPYARK